MKKRAFRCGVTVAQFFSLMITDNLRQSKSLMAMQGYQEGWNVMRARTAKKLNRPESETLLQCSEEFKARTALIQNLNIVYDLHEFSGDNIFYCSLRGDTHPNAPSCNLLHRMRMVPRGAWDGGESRGSSRWMKSEYLKKRLDEYGPVLMQAAPFCISDSGNLEVIGTSLLPKSSLTQQISQSSLSVSIDLANHSITVINRTCAFIFWSLKLCTARPPFYSIKPADGGVYPNGSFKLDVGYDEAIPTRPEELWVIETESGESIPINLPS